MSLVYAGESDTSEVIAFEAINYYVVRHFNAYSVAVTGFLSPEVELPARVEIAVPTGSEITWFSEFSGGPIENDPEFIEPFDVRTEGSLDIYTVTTRYNHAVQVEYRTDDDLNSRISSGVYSLSMEYTPVADTPILRLMTNLPAESRVEDPTVEFMGEDEHGRLVFMRMYTDVPALTVVQGEITYMPPAGQGMIVQGGNPLSGLGIAITVAIGTIVVVGLFVYLGNRRRQMYSDV